MVSKRSCGQEEEESSRTFPQNCCAKTTGRRVLSTPLLRPYGVNCLTAVPQSDQTAVTIST